MQTKGHEFGVTTGRKRRCGWLDIPLLQYTSMVNGYTSVALTKLDILDELEEIQIGIKYLKNGQVMDHFPSCEQVLNTGGSRIFDFHSFYSLSCCKSLAIIHKLPVENC